MMSIFINKFSSYQNFLGTSLVNNNWTTGFNGVLYIAAGMGMNSISYLKGMQQYLNSRGETDSTILDSKRKYEQYKEYLVDYVKTLPSHYEFLLEHIYGGTDEYI